MTLKRAAILLHGLSGTSEDLLPVQQVLRTAGFTVVTPLVPGYSYDPAPAASGSASTESPSWQWTQWVADIQARIALLRNTHDQVCVVGISCGAVLALASALASEGHPPAAPDAMVLMSTALRLDGWEVPSWQRWLPWALNTPLGRWWLLPQQATYSAKNERIREWLKLERDKRPPLANAHGTWLPPLREQARMSRFVQQHLSQLACNQVLALHAMQDNTASPANVKLLEKALGSTGLRSRLFSNSYHMMSIDNDRLEVAHETVAFLLGREPAALAADATHSTPR